MSAKNKTLALILAALAAACMLCTVGAVLLGGLGLIASSDVEQAEQAEQAERASLSFEVPAVFQPAGEGRWSAERSEGPARYLVELIKLPPVAGRVGSEALLELWTASILRDWPGAPVKPLPLRRYANNGARVFFGAASVKAAGAQHPTYLTLYLVEADDHFEPFVVIQSFFDDSVGATMREPGAPDASHDLVESLFKGINGSPTGRTLVSNDEIVGTWTANSGNHLQYINVVTGSTGFNAVASTTSWTFDSNGEFSYRYSGAVTDTGNTRFAGQEDRGRWSLERDLLLTDGDTLKRRFFIAGAGEGPTGKRFLLLMPEGRWSLSPGAVAREAQFFEEQ